MFCVYSERLIVDGRKLHLIDVNFTNDGVYQCAAENNYGMIVSATWVHVKGRYKIYDEMFFLEARTGNLYSTTSLKVDGVAGNETKGKGRKK